MAVIVDAMGGDHAPSEVVQGAVAAAREFGIDVVLVGRRPDLERLPIDCPRVTIEHADDVVGMDESPAMAVRKKPHSSIAVGARLAKATPGSAFVSAGNTGALMATTLLEWGRIPGVERPGLAALIPSETKSCVVLDVGANVDCKPSHLRQFAIMGAAYAKYVLKVENPTVGLLNNGEEEKKGNELNQAVFALLKQTADITFAGNVEPVSIYGGRIDVVVTDGFAGNIFLKTSEALSDLLQNVIRAEIERLGTPDLFAGMKARLGRYSTRNPLFSGAPLLGLEGACIKAHGGSRAQTIKNCVSLAQMFAQSDTLRFIKEHVAA